MVREVIVSRRQHDRRIDFEQRLINWVDFIDYAYVHRADTSLCSGKCCSKALLVRKVQRVDSTVAIISDKLAFFLREQSCEASLEIVRSWSRMQAKSISDVVASTDIQVVVVFSKEVDTLLWHGYATER